MRPLAGRALDGMHGVGNVGLVGPGPMADRRHHGYAEGHGVAPSSLMPASGKIGVVLSEGQASKTCSTYS